MSRHVLYEEEGELKAGTVLSEAPASFQVETPHGRRTKVKAASVLLSFDQPAPAALLEDARAYAVKLTDTGRRILHETEPCAKRVDQRILEALPPRQRDQFVEELSMIVATLNRLSAAPAEG